MANPFTSVSCSIRYDNARILSWTMMPGANYPKTFIMRVENSRGGGPWEVLATDVQDCCIWIDTRKRNYNKRMNEYYRLRLIVPDKNEEWVSDIVDAGNYKAYPYSAVAENVLSQIEVAMKESGTPGKLMKRKLWGVRCPDCVDFTGQQTVNEHCPRCLGTGIDGGYYPGIPLDVIKDSIETSESPSQLGYVQGESVKARCIAFPWINRGDIWCEDISNNKYVIAQITPTSSYKQTHLVYTIGMNKVELNDILHSDAANTQTLESGAWISKTAPVKPPEDTNPEHTRNDWDSILEEL